MRSGLGRPGARRYRAGDRPCARSCWSVRERSSIGQQQVGLVVAASRYGSRVPRLSAFYGIVIAMYFDDHPPPHFHARYGEYEAQVAIASGEILNGSLPRRAEALVIEWSQLHRAELEADWELARREQPLVSIEPLP